MHNVIIKEDPVAGTFRSYSKRPVFQSVIQESSRKALSYLILSHKLMSKVQKDQWRKQQEQTKPVTETTLKLGFLNMWKYL